MDDRALRLPSSIQVTSALSCTDTVLLSGAPQPTQPSRRPDARESHHPCMTWFPAFDITVVSCPASSLTLLQRPLIGQGNPAPPPRVSLPSQSPRGTIHPFASVLSLVTSHTRLTSAKANGANHDQPTVDSRHWKKQPAIHPTTGLFFFFFSERARYQTSTRKKKQESAPHKLLLLRPGWHRTQPTKKNPPVGKPSPRGLYPTYPTIFPPRPEVATRAQAYRIREN